MGIMSSLEEYLTQDKLKHLLTIANEYKWYLTGTAVAGYALLKVINRPNLPPGPRGWPFIGAPGELSSNMHEDALRIGKTYNSDIVSVNIYAQLMIIINSQEAIKEALIKQSDQFAHKPPFSEKNFYDDIVSPPYNEEWKTNKKFAMATLRNYGYGTKAGENMTLNVIDEVLTIFGEAGGQPVSLIDIFQRSLACVSFNLLIGTNLQYHDETLDKFLEAHHGFANVIFNPLSYAEKRLPGWLSKIVYKDNINQRDATCKKWAVILQDIIKGHLTDFNPDNPRDVIDGYIKERGADQLNVSTMSCNIMSFSIDAINTLGSVANSVLFYLAKHQDVQSRVQEQLDAVVGSSRKVTMKDKPLLPLMDAVVYESLRIITPFALSLQRTMEQTTTLQGFKIPKGAAVWMNIFAVHHNEKNYPDPERFNIENFLEKDGSFKRSTDTWLAFSMGRRMCIGEMMAKMELFLFISNLLLRFKLSFPQNFCIPGDNEIIMAGVARETPKFEMVFTER